MSDYNKQVEKLRKTSEALTAISDFLALIDGRALANLIDEAADTIEELSAPNRTD